MSPRHGTATASFICCVLSEIQRRFEFFSADHAKQSEHEPYSRTPLNGACKLYV